MYGIYGSRAPSAFSLVGITDLLDNTVVLAIAAGGLTLVILSGVSAGFYIVEVGLIASIQAFIFAALSAIYIGAAIEPDH